MAVDRRGTFCASRIPARARRVEQRTTTDTQILGPLLGGPPRPAGAADPFVTLAGEQAEKDEARRALTGAVLILKDQRLGSCRVGTPGGGMTAQSGGCSLPSRLRAGG